MKENSKYLKGFVCLILGCFLLWSGDVMGAGIWADPPINTAGTVISVTNGPATCHKNDDDDKVNLSVSGGSDEDCVEGYGAIDYDETRWTCTKGYLDSSTGETNKWLADVEESGVVIRVYLNDAYCAPEYDDDESPSADDITVTGFIVGVELTTSPSSGSYKKWENGNTEGSKPVEWLDDTLCSSYNSSAGTDYDYDEDQCNATWKIITYPVLGGTDVKGSVSASGSSEAFDRWDGPPSHGYFLKASDEDPDDSGSLSFGVSINALIISFSASYSFPDAESYACAGAGLGFGSNFGATAGGGDGVSLVSADEEYPDTIELYSAAMSSSGGWIADPQETREGVWKSRAETKTKLTETDEEYERYPSSSDAKVEVKCEFDIPNNPSYNP